MPVKIIMDCDNEGLKADQSESAAAAMFKRCQGKRRLAVRNSFAADVVFKAKSDSEPGRSGANSRF